MDYVVVSTGGHDFVFLKYKENNLTLPQLYNDAISRWVYKKAVSFLVLRQKNDGYVEPGDTFCGYDNRKEYSLIDGWLKEGLIRISL